MDWEVGMIEWIQRYPEHLGDDPAGARRIRGLLRAEHTAEAAFQQGIPRQWKHGGALCPRGALRCDHVCGHRYLSESIPPV